MTVISGSKKHADFKFNGWEKSLNGEKTMLLRKAKLNIIQLLMLTMKTILTLLLEGGV